MNTPRLDEKIEELTLYKRCDELSELSTRGEETLIEFKEIKQALNIACVSYCEHPLKKLQFHTNGNIVCECGYIEDDSL